MNCGLRQIQCRAERPAKAWFEAIFALLVASASITPRLALAQAPETPTPKVAASAPPSGSAELVPSAVRSATQEVAKKDAAAQIFVGTCAGCHTVGGGALRGPDLAPTATWPEAQIAASVQSMQRKVGPLSQAQVSDLVELLKDRAVKDRISKARANLAADAEVRVEPPNSMFGGALFFGKVALENGGMACSSCHRFRGEGGDLGPDLSDYAAPLDIEGLAGSISRASFPVMRTAYQGHPITMAEGRHIAAFMKQAKTDRNRVTASTITSAGLGSGVAAFIAVLFYVATRPRGIRSKLVQRATKR